ncbi:MAG: signal peptidase I [Coriobacteriia bacterium]|nr:signal peptidase I [Coriobacteriia bacterium]
MGVSKGYKKSMVEIDRLIDELKAAEQADAPVSAPKPMPVPVPAQQVSSSVSSPQSRPWKRRVVGAVFYGALVALIVVIVMATGQRSNAPRTLFGYSALTVLTGSMQSEIPQGSLVITKSVDPATIQVGDDITYMLNANTSVTHKVITIYEPSESSAQCWFQTKGVDNNLPDQALVAASNVVGRVIFHVPAVGRIAELIGGNAVLIALFLLAAGALLYAVFLCLRWMLRPSIPREKGVLAA